MHQSSSRSDSSLLQSNGDLPKKKIEDLQNFVAMQRSSSSKEKTPDIVSAGQSSRDEFLAEESSPAKPKRKSDELKQNLSSSDDDVSVEDGKEEGQESDDGDDDMFKKFRREKRLAMNRASARARRKKKKVMLETLTTKVTELTKQNQSLQGTNDTLIRKVERLEEALAKAQETIKGLLEGRQRAAAAAAPAALYPGLLGGVSTAGLGQGATAGAALGGAGALGVGGAATAAAEAYQSLLLRGSNVTPSAATTASRLSPSATSLSAISAADPYYAAALQQQVLAMRAGGQLFGEMSANLGQSSNSSDLRLSDDPLSSMFVASTQARATPSQIPSELLSPSVVAGASNVPQAILQASAAAARAAEQQRRLLDATRAQDREKK